ncbi:hypothetical protein IE81DRAFT_345168 [Ceraceosorus guamensis]|uniref:PI31 proteasome regulator N-terminal domain-containing protein n=1 Tax=Ceraceosorus guamensis TaxID=1522189 RepID=A0A316W5U5_9BASI|nr:hypothetical protein IE81DRAFT_345168 [Ceraceosorus guamensis]PWN45122.1 hypothetical protein IE81DRAFT_345168 [Ceraceosorus guamensis]
MSGTSSSLLDPAALLELLPTLLPSDPSSSPHDEAGGSSAAPSREQASLSQLHNPIEALVALLHSIFTRLDFRFLGLHTPQSPPPSSNVLPPTWAGSSSSGSFALSYAHPQSSLRFLVRASTLGPRIIINATALEGQDRSASLELEVDRFTSKNFWPWPRSASQATTSSAPEPLVNGYVSSSRIMDFVSEVQLHIVQRLLPGLHKAGYEELPDPSPSSASSSQPSSSRRQPPPEPHPSGPIADDPRYPGATGGPLFPGPRNPLAVGDRDRDPLGGLGGVGGFGPPPLFPGGDDGGGMFVGPNHPMFRDRFDPTRGDVPPFGAPQPGGNPFAGPVPPGARFDPVGPGGIGGFPRPGVGGPLGGPGRPGQGNRQPTGDPDWDDVRPPRNSDYDNMFM